MLLERAELTVRAGAEAEFEAAMREIALPILRDVPGVRSAQMGRSVENPAKYMLLVEWESMEIHGKFRDLPVYPQFVGAFHGFTEGGAMEHFRME